MDQSRYWMIQKERTCLNSHAFGDSWEEQAFAEDAAGPLGGCVWPPRSYTCSFCRREFRSAQALGGHMNVHRRDRAKLKLHNINSGGSSNNQILESANTSFDRRVLQNPIEICNPNFDLDHALFSSSSSPRPSTASILRPFTCSFSQAEQQPILSCSKFEPRKRFHILQDLAGNQDTGCITKVVELNSTDSKKNNHEVDEVHLTGKLNSLVRKRCETPSFHDEEDGLIFKKRQIDDGADHYFFPKNSKLQVINGDELVEPRAVVQLHKRSPNSTLESLDLELRLGT